MSFLALTGPEIILDPSILSGTDPRAFSRFLSDNKDALGQRINSTAKALLDADHSRGENDRGLEPTFVEDPGFARKRPLYWRTFLRQRICVQSAHGSIMSLVLPITVYLHDAYGASCSSVILGQEMPTVPSLWLRKWLQLVPLMSAVDTAKLQQILKKGPVSRCDTLYVLQSRLQELAVEEGQRPEEFIVYPGIFANDVSLIQAFAQLELAEKGNAYLLQKPYLGSHKMLRLVISMCIRCQVSPDYLLLQDYSEYAVTPDGRKYPAYAQELMSKLLRADLRTRREAVGFVMAAVAKRIAAGELSAAVMQMLEETPINTGREKVQVMADYSRMMVTDGRAKAEDNIVQRLKVQILDILETDQRPVSSEHLFSLVDGIPRTVRSALTQLVREGKVERVPQVRGAAYWQLKH